MAVSREDVLRVASLARLRLSDEEVDRFTRQLNDILAHMEELNAIDIGGVEAVGGATEWDAPLRGRTCGRTGSPFRAASAMAPEWIDGFFTVPRLAALDTSEMEEPFEDKASAASKGRPCRERGRRRGVSGEVRTLREWAAAVKEGRESAESGLRSTLNAIERLDGGPDGLNAFLSVNNGAVEAAAAIDRAIVAGEKVGPLAGVPIAVKDNLCTLDLPTTCGSKCSRATALPTRPRSYGSFGRRVRWWSGRRTSTNSQWAPPRRVRRSARRVTRTIAVVSPAVPQGGSAAAVAAGMVPAALGSETGGSVRQPASFCGVVGIKPSYGRVSRYGLAAFASSLDQVGTFGRTVEDAALLLEVISGPDRFDSTTADRPAPSLVAEIGRGVEGMVVGVPKEYFPPALDERIAALCRDSIERLRAAGAEIREITLPHTRYAIPTYYIIAPAEASSNLARYDGIRYGLRAPGRRVDGSGL